VKLYYRSDGVFIYLMSFYILYLTNRDGLIGHSTCKQQIASLLVAHSSVAVGKLLAHCASVAKLYNLVLTTRL